MATHHGKSGSAKVGANAIAEIQNWTVEEEAELAEDTAMGDSAKTYIAGVNGWTASIECSWDETDTNGQEALTIGATVTLNLYPEGTGAGATYKTGSAIVEKRSISTPRNGIVSASFTARGTGALTQTTV